MIKRRAVSPLKLDPSRTATLRRLYSSEFTRKFNSLQRDIYQLIVTDDIFGIAADRRAGVRNSACGAGDKGDPGFQPDNTCSKGDLVKRFPRVRSSKQLVDGRKVLKDVPNTSSISSSLTDYEVMPGIREVDAVKEFGFPRKGGSYSASEQERTKDLAERIRRSGKVSPLIVVIDREGPYILEGGHRFDALNILGAKSFPAMVVIDRSPDIGIPTTNSDCGAGSKGDPGFQPGNKCAAKDFIKGTATGEVEVYDPNTGQVFTKVSAEEARRMLKEEQEAGGDMDTLAVRPVTAETEAEAERKRAEFWKSVDQRASDAKRIESLKTPSGLLPGHPDYVDPPAELFHATYAEDEIRAEGFKSSDELGTATLGGSSGHLISFTTRSNAERYRDGLNVARRAARGELTDAEVIQAAQAFGVSQNRARAIVERHKGNPRDRSFNIWQDISFEGKQFPLFVGTAWPEGIEDRKPATLVSISSVGIPDVLYAPGETEWRLTSTGANRLTANTRWRFRTDATKVELFMQWLRQNVNEKLLQQNQSKPWYAKYVDSAYRKGMNRAFIDTHKPAMAKKMDFYQGTRAQFLESAFSRPVSAERVKLLAGRVLTDLQGVTESMSAGISRELVDGMIRGDGPREVARNIAKQVNGIGRKRALTLARTETLRAHNEGALDAFEELGVTRLGVAVEWSTSKLGVTKAGYPSPCKLCAPLDGIVLTIKEARGLFPRHPNCMCVPIPANLGEKTDKQKKSRSKIFKAINDSIKAEIPKKSKRSLITQRKLSWWKGAGVNISPKRPKSIIPEKR